MVKAVLELVKQHKGSKMKPKIWPFPIVNNQRTAARQAMLDKKQVNYAELQRKETLSKLEEVLF